MATKKTARADGRFQEKLRVDGKYKYFYGQTQREARAKKEAFIRSMDTPKPREEMTVREWAEKWLAGSSSKEKTRKSNALYVQKIVDAYGDRAIADIRKSDIKALATAAGTRSFSYSRKMKSVTTRFFADALDDALILQDPCRKVTWEYAKKGTHRALEDWEKAHITEHWREHRCGIWALLMLYAGLRRGETMALTWEDVDWDKNILTVNKTYVFEGNKAILNFETKTEAGMRSVPLPGILRRALQEVGPSSGQICGEKITHSYFKRGWESYIHAMENVLNGLPAQNKGRRTDLMTDEQKVQRKAFSIRPHDLRHTYCTMLYEAGVGLKEAQYLMGHDDIKTTLEIYTHLSKKQTASAYDKLNAYLES